MIAASTAIKWRIIMKLVSFAASGRNSYGAVVGDGVFDLGRRLGDRYPTLRAAIAGDALGAAAAEAKSGAPDIALSQVTLLPPITDPDKIICAGRNYRAHAAEAGGPPPENPRSSCGWSTLLSRITSRWCARGSLAISTTRASWPSSSASPAAISPSQMRL